MKSQLSTARAIGLVMCFALLANCGGGAASRAVVSRVGDDDFLRLRAGPGLGYNAILGLPNGTEVVRQECVTEVGQLWCRVGLAEARSITGYVAADYLSP